MRVNKAGESEGQSCKPRVKPPAFLKPAAPRHVPSTLLVYTARLSLGLTLLVLSAGLWRFLGSYMVQG